MAMTIRTTMVLALLAGACGARKDKPAPSATAAATDGKVETAVDASSDPAPVAAADSTAPGPSPALKAALGLDGPGAPAAVDPSATARFAAISSMYEAARQDIVKRIRIYRVENGALVIESEAELPA